MHYHVNCLGQSMTTPFTSTSGGKVATFFLFEFDLTNGLKITGDEAAHDCTQRSNRLHNAYFQGRDGASTVANLHNQGVQPDVRQSKVVYILESVVQYHHKKIAIDLFYLEIVDDINSFNNYPQGWRCFQDTVHAFTESHSKSKGSVCKYDTYGLTLIVQVNI